MKTFVYRYVFIDNCVVNRLAEANINPVKILEGSEFQVSFTPDLEFEYRQGLGHPTVAPHIKTLLQSLLDHGVRHGFVGFDGAPRSGFDEGRFISSEEQKTLAAIPTRARHGHRIPANRTDSHLVALSQTEIVITADNKLPWKLAAQNAGLIFWYDLQRGLQTGLTLIEFLRSRAAIKRS